MDDVETLPLEPEHEEWPDNQLGLEGSGEDFSENETDEKFQELVTPHDDMLIELQPWEYEQYMASGSCDQKSPADTASEPDMEPDVDEIDQKEAKQVIESDEEKIAASGVHKDTPTMNEQCLQYLHLLSS